MALRFAVAAAPVAAQATEPEKKREMLQKILYPHRFGKAKLGLKGGRRARLVPQRVQGDADDGDDDDDFMDMPKFAVSHEGWLSTKIGMMGKLEKRYVALKQGTLSLYVDHETLESVLSGLSTRTRMRSWEAEARGLSPHIRLLKRWTLFQARGC